MTNQQSGGVNDESGVVLYLIHHSAFTIHHFRSAFYTQKVLFDTPQTLCYHHADPKNKTRHSRSSTVLDAKT